MYSFLSPFLQASWLYVCETAWSCPTFFIFLGVVKVLRKILIHLTFAFKVLPVYLARLEQPVVLAWLSHTTLLVSTPSPNVFQHFPMQAGGNVSPCRPCVSPEDSRRVGLCLAPACLLMYPSLNRSAERQVWRVFRKHPEFYSFFFFFGVM